MAKQTVDIENLYNLLLARGYQEELFQDLPGKRHRQKGGQETLVECPFCHKPDHFSYSSREPLWKCWSCQKGGDWIKYLEQIKRLDFREALLFLADAAGVEVSGADSQAYRSYTQRASLLEAAQKLFVEELLADVSESRAVPVLDYLGQRGYNLGEVEAMELGAYVSKDSLQQELLRQGYSQKELWDSGLLLKGLGETHQLTLLWRDPAGRAIGIAARSLLNREELKARGLPPYLYSAGLQKGQGLVGMASARGEEQLILVEGPLDALYLQSMGLKAVAMGGTSLSPAQVKALQSNRTREILLALDRDKAGQEATERAIEILRLSELRSYVVSLPEGYKDPDELVRDKGKEAFEKCLRTAERWPTWMARRIVSRQDISTDIGLDRALEEALELYSGIEDMLDRRAFQEALGASVGLSAEELSQKLEKISLKASQQASREALQGLLNTIQQKATEGDILGAELELEHGLQRLRTARGVTVPEPYLVEDLEADILTTSDGLRTGYEGLDNILKIPQGAITIVAGRPGHGKTTMLLNLLVNQLSLYPDRAFYLFSFEEARKFLALKLIMLMAGEMLSQDFNLEAYLHYFKEGRGKRPAIDKAISTYQQLTESGRLLISDSMPAAEDLAATIGWLASRGKVGAVYVDYIQKIPLQQPLQQRYIEIKRVSELLLRQAVQQDIPIILGAQLGRATGQKSKVSLDNLRESGDIEQDSSLVLGLFNQSVEDAEEQQQPVKAREVELKVTILKQRGGVAGATRTLKFDRPVLKIKDKDKTGL